MRRRLEEVREALSGSRYHVPLTVGHSPSYLLQFVVRDIQVRQQWKLQIICEICLIKSMHNSNSDLIKKAFNVENRLDFH